MSHMFTSGLILQLKNYIASLCFLEQEKGTCSKSSESLCGHNSIAHPDFDIRRQTFVWLVLHIYHDSVLIRQKVDRVSRIKACFVHQLIQNWSGNISILRYRKQGVPSPNTILTCRDVWWPAGEMWTNSNSQMVQTSANPLVRDNPKSQPISLTYCMLHFSEISGVKDSEMCDVLHSLKKDYLVKWFPDILQNAERQSRVQSRHVHTDQSSIFTLILPWWLMWRILQNESVCVGDDWEAAPCKQQPQKTNKQTKKCCCLLQTVFACENTLADYRGHTGEKKCSTIRKLIKLKIIILVEWVSAPHLIKGSWNLRTTQNLFKPNCVHFLTVQLQYVRHDGFLNKKHPISQEQCASPLAK